MTLTFTRMAIVYVLFVLHLFFGSCQRLRSFVRLKNKQNKINYSCDGRQAVNRGSVIAKLTAKNVLNHPNLFEPKILMYIYEELIEGQKLSEIINTTHVNVKYLPEHPLPENVIAVPDLTKACSGSDILLFAVPQEFVASICSQLKLRTKKGAMAVTMIKGLGVREGRLTLISNIIRKTLNIPCAALMGANVAQGIADEEFCEATLGCVDLQQAETLKKLFEASFFRIRCVPDEECVELCSSLKNVIAFAAGLVDGLKLGGANTKATILRLGFMEMIEFCRRYFPNTRLETFFESCAMAELMASSYAGRNRMVAERFGSGDEKSIEDLENELLNGQKLQGPVTAANVFAILEKESAIESDVMEKFPIMCGVHLVITKAKPVKEFPQCFHNHPQHGLL